MFPGFFLCLDVGSFPKVSLTGNFFVVGFLFAAGSFAIHLPGGCGVNIEGEVGGSVADHGADGLDVGAGLLFVGDVGFAESVEGDLRVADGFLDFAEVVFYGPVGDRRAIRPGEYQAFPIKILVFCFFPIIGLTFFLVQNIPYHIVGDEDFPR